MPTGGAAIMRKGPNLVKLARKEQCLALTTQLRTKFKTDACFYRVFPSGEVQYLHPKDGVYPEKVNPGREGVNQNMRSIGENVNPIEVIKTDLLIFWWELSKLGLSLIGYLVSSQGCSYNRNQLFK